MITPIDPVGDDDLARQRRKREARLLDREVAGFPGVTLADLVADVLAASEGGRPLEVGRYLEARGHHWQTIEAVVGHLHRQYQPDPSNSRQLRLP